MNYTHVPIGPHLNGESASSGAREGDLYECRDLLFATPGCSVRPDVLYSSHQDLLTYRNAELAYSAESKGM